MIVKALSNIPYAGLEAYSEKLAPFFYGRDKVRENLIANLKAKRLTLVFGASGVGKSSVLRAGVKHKLRRLAQKNLYEKGRPEFAVALFNKWAGDPVAGLTTCVQEAIGEALDEPTLAPVAPSDSFADTLRSWTARLDGDLLIILDQFEDYFLYHGDEDDASGFAYELARLINRSDLRVNLLISIRDDALSKIKRFKESRFFDNVIEIEHLDRESATAAIKNPIDRYNSFYAAGNQRISIEPALVEEVLKQLWELRTERLALGEGGNGVSTKKTGAKASKGRFEAPFLQLVMTRLWESEIRQGATALTLTALNRLGDAKMSGAKRIVKTHVTQVMDRLSGNEQAIASRIFLYLVTPSGDKFARSVSDLAEAEELDKQAVAQLLEKLAHGDSRILRTFALPGSDGESRYEIFHDVLGPVIADWRRAYKERRAAEKARAEERARTRRIVWRGFVVLLALILAAVTISLILRARAAAQARIAADEREHRLRLRKSDLANQTIARLNWHVIKDNDPQNQIANSQFLLKELNERLGLYRQDENKAGEGITLNHIGAISRLLGDAYTSAGDYAKAQDYYQKAKDAYQTAQPLLEATLGSDHPEVATSLTDLAVIYVAQGKYGEAEPLFEQSLAILEKVVEQPDDDSLVEPIENLATCYKAQGKYGEAEALYNRALEIRRNKFKNHSGSAQSVNNLAWLYYEQGKYAQAETLFKDSLEIWKNASDPDSEFDPAFGYDGLGTIYRKRRKYDLAEGWFQQSRQYHKLKDKTYSSVAGDSENTGLRFADQGMYDLAEPLFNIALDLWKQSLGDDHPRIAYGLNNRASFYYQRGKVAEAAGYFKDAEADFQKAKADFDEAQRIQKNALPLSPELARTLNGLARLYTDAGKYDEAEPLFRQALEIQEKAIPAHPDFAETLNNYAALLQKTNREAEAAQRRQRAEQIQDTHKRENPDN